MNSDKRDDRFYVRIAVDFLRHHPEKLEQTISDAFKIGYQSGLWDALDSIKKLPGYEDDDLA